MKKFIIPFIFMLCICISLCSCYSSDDEYNEFESKYEETSEELDSLKEDSLNRLHHTMDYIKEIETQNNIPNYAFGDTWSVEDFFNFSLYYDSESEAICYNLKTKDGYPIRFIWDETTEIQDLFIAVYRSDGSFETVEGFGDEDTLIYIPEYNYSYEILLFATVNNKVYRANYNFSIEDTK